MAAWAGELLRHWLQVRAELKITGLHLFPSTRTGKPWSRLAHYVAARQVLQDAGLDSSEARRVVSAAAHVCDATVAPGHRGGTGGRLARC